MLRPSPRVNDIILGVLGRAQRLYGVALHAFVFLSTHFHLLATVDSAEQLAAFAGYVNANIAREIGRLHGWSDKFWSRRYQAILVSDEEIAQVSRLLYIFRQGSKEGLVARPQDWPGVQCVSALLEGQPVLVGTWLDRSGMYEARQRGETPRRSDYTRRETVELTPLPCWEHLETEEIQDAIRGLVTQIIEQTALEHAERGTEPLGVKAIRKQRALDRPVKTKKSPAPAFHAASRTAYRKMCSAYAAFVEAYRDASERLRAGEFSVIFPNGCFPPPLPFVHLELDPAPG